MVVDEKKQVQEDTGEDKTDGDKSTGFNLVEQAREEREGLARENDRAQKILEEMRELEASRQLGGTAGGRVEPQPVKEETDAEYAERIKREIAIGKHNGS